MSMNFLLLFVLFFFCFSASHAQAIAVQQIDFKLLQQKINQLNTDNKKESLSYLSKLKNKIRPEIITLNGDLVANTDTVHLDKIVDIVVLEEDQIFGSTNKYTLAINLFYQNDFSKLQTKITQLDSAFFIKKANKYKHIDYKQMNIYSNYNIYKFTRASGDTNFYKDLPFIFSIHNLGTVGWDRTTMSVTNGMLSRHPLNEGQFTIIPNDSSFSISIMQAYTYNNKTLDFNYSVLPSTFVLHRTKQIKSTGTSAKRKSSKS